MSFAVFADGSANLPKSMLEGISLLPCDYTVDGEPYTYWGDVDSFDAHSFYEGLRNGTVVRTTLLNTSLFLSRFAPILTQGIDIIYISMSSGISGTYNAARIAAAGGDLVMPGGPGDLKALLNGLKEGAVTRKQLLINASRVVRMAKKLTEAANAKKEAKP